MLVKMELIKNMAIYYDFDNLDLNKFKLCSFEELKVGDIVKTSTMTFSQKYMLWDGYEDCNMTKIGILLNKSKYPGDSTLFKYNFESNEFEETILYRDVGSSGCVTIEKYIDK